MKTRRYTSRLQILTEIERLRMTIQPTLVAADEHDVEADNAFKKANDRRLGSEQMEEWAIEGKRLRKLAKSERKRVVTIEESTIPRLTRTLAAFDTMLLPMVGNKDDAVVTQK